MVTMGGVRIPMAPVLMLICLIVVLQATEVAAASAADYYKTLGLPRSATAQQVKKKYRQMARKYHPDVNRAPGVKEKFQEINKAYEILGDEEKRKQYDQFGDTGDGPMGGGGGGPPGGGGRHGSSSFTGTHFDNFYHFGGARQQPGGGFRPPPDFEFMFQNQQGGGGRRSSQSQQQQGRGRKAKASSSSSATATSRSTFSFENLFGANAFGSSGGGGDDGNNAKATASRSTTKSSPSWFESMFGGGGGGGGTPPHQEDPSEDGNERRRSSQQQGKSSSNKKKDKRSNGHGGANPEEYARRFGAKQAPSFKEGGGGAGDRKDKPNMKEEAGDGIPKREDTARFKEMFDETDESSRPPPDMFQGVNSPDDMTPEQSEHFQSWFNKKFSGGGGPGGGGGGPGGGGGGPPPDFASMFGGSKKKKTPKDGKKSQSEDSTPKKKKGRDSSSQSERSTSYEEEKKTADKAKSKKKKNAEREEQESSTHSVLEFSPVLFNKHCVQLKRRCIFIFGGSTTYLSGKITFRSIAERYASVAVAGKSSPVESRVFFVSRHNVLEADAALRAAMHLDDGDIDTKSESLCSAYGSTSRYGDKAKLAHLAGEHCVVVLSGSGKRYGVIAKYVKGTSGEDAPLVTDAAQSIRTDADVVKHLERLFNDDSVSSSSGEDGGDTSKKVFKAKWRRMSSAVRAMEVVQPHT